MRASLRRSTDITETDWLRFLDFVHHICRNLAYLIIAQAIPAFDYEIGVRMGTQEPASRITEVGVAFWKGFAWGDLLVYIPLLGMGLAGHRMARRWG